MEINLEVLKQCPVLIGPSNVGKTLISETLSKKLGIPVISIDEIFVLTGYELSGKISSSKLSQKQFVSDRIAVCNHFKDLKVNKRNRELKRKQREMIEQHVEVYNAYHKLLCGFADFYDIAYDYNTCFQIFDSVDFEDNNTNVALLQFYHLQALVKVISKLKKPAIIDTSAFQGWKLPIDDICEHDKNAMLSFDMGLDVKQLKNSTQAVFNILGTSIFIHPGIDFAERTANCKTETTNTLIENNLEQYFDFADICISANGLFRDSSNPAFSTRYYYDAKSMDKKEQLLNKCELSNIVEIIASELEILKQNTTQFGE